MRAGSAVDLDREAARARLREAVVQRVGVARRGGGRGAAASPATTPRGQPALRHSDDALSLEGPTGAAGGRPALSLEAPPGFEAARELLAGLQQELRPELAAKLACLDGARKMIAQRTQDAEAYIGAINGIVGDFPRSSASFYGRAIGRLAAHGGKCAEALCLAVLVWMPAPEGQAAELSRDTAADYTYSWLQDLKEQVGFTAFRDSLGQHYDAGSPVHQHLVEYTVEVVAADLIYNLLLRAAQPVHPAVAERLQRRAVASFIKHPAWCPAYSGMLARRRSYKVYRRGGSGLLGKEEFRPQAAMMSVSRAAIYDQWAAILGVLSRHYLKPVVETVLQLVRLGNSDPLSMVLLSACRYVAWSTLSSVETLAMRQFLRFNIGLVDNFRGTNERLLHINLFDSVLKHADCTFVNHNHDAMSLFQHEIMEVYNMALRWSTQDGLHSSSNLLISTILAKCPNHAMNHLQGFFSKKILKMLRRGDRADIAARCLLVILQGRYIPKEWGWRVHAPCAGAGGGVKLGGVKGLSPRHMEHWRPWDADSGRAYAFVAREDESGEARKGRVVQIWETVFQCTKDGSMVIRPRSVEALVALVVQSAAQSLSYVLGTVLPRLLAGACEGGHAQADRAASGSGLDLWKVVALRAIRTMLDPCSGFVENAARGLATVQDGHTINGKSFRDALHDLIFKLADVISEVAIEVNLALKTGEVPRELRPFPPQILNPYHEVRGIVENSYDVVFEVMIAAQYSGRALKMVKALQSALNIKNKSALQYTSSSIIGVIGSDMTALANLWRLDFCQPSLSELGIKPLPVASIQNPPCNLPDEGISLLREIVLLLPFLDPIAACGSAPGGEGFMGELLLSQSEDLRQAASAVIQAVAREHPHNISNLLVSVGNLLPLCLQAAAGDIFYILAHVGIILETWMTLLQSEALPAAFLHDSEPILGMEALIIAYMTSPSQNVRRMSLQVLQLCDALLQEQQKGARSPRLSLGGIFESGGDDIIIRAALRMLREKHVRADLDGEEALNALTMNRFSLKQLAEAPCKHHRCWELPSSKRHEVGTVCVNETELYANAMAELGLHIGESLSSASAIRSHASYLCVAILRNFDGASGSFQDHGHDWVNLLSFFVSLHVGATAVARGRGDAVAKGTEKSGTGDAATPSAFRDVTWIVGREMSHRECFACLATQTRDQLQPQLQGWRNNFIRDRDLKHAEGAGRGGDRLDLMGKWVKNHTRNTPYIPVDFKKTSDSEMILLELQEFLSSGVLFQPFLSMVSGVREACSKVLSSIHWSAVESALLSLRKWHHETSGSAEATLETLDKIMSNYDLRYSLAMSPGILKIVTGFLSSFENFIFEKPKELVSRLKRGDSSLFVGIMSNPAIQKHLHTYANIIESVCEATRAVGIAWGEGFLTHVFHLIYGCFSAQKKISTNLVTMPTDSHLVVSQQVLHAMLNAMGESELSEFKKAAYFQDAPSGGFGESVVMQLKEDEDFSYFQDLARKACTEHAESKQFFDTIYQYIVPATNQGSIHQLMATEVDSAERIARYGPLIVAVGALHLTSEDPSIKSAAVEILVFCANTFDMMFSSTVEQNAGFLEIQASMVLSKGGTTASRSHCFQLLKEVVRRCGALIPEVVIQMSHIAVFLANSGHSSLDWFLDSLGPWLYQLDLEAFDNRVVTSGNFKNLSDSKGSAFEILQVLHSAFASAEKKMQEQHGDKRDSLFCTWTSFLSNIDTRESNAPRLLDFVLQLSQKVENANTCSVIAIFLYRECPPLAVGALLKALGEVLNISKAHTGYFGGRKAASVAAAGSKYKTSAAAASILTQLLCEPESLQECGALPELLCFGFLLCDIDSAPLRRAARELLASAIACPAPLKSSTSGQLEGRRREQVSASKLCSELKSGYTGTIVFCGAGSNPKGIRSLGEVISCILRYLDPCSEALAHDFSKKLLTWSLDVPTTHLSTRAVQAYMHCGHHLQAGDVHTVLQLLVRKFVITSSRWSAQNEAERSPGFDLVLGVLQMFQKCSAAVPPTSYAIFWTSVALFMSGAESITHSAARALMSDRLCGVEAASENDEESFWKYCTTWSPTFDGLAPLLFRALLRGHALDETASCILRYGRMSTIFAPKVLQQSSETLRQLLPVVLCIPHLFNCLQERAQLKGRSPQLVGEIRRYAVCVRVTNPDLADVLGNYASGAFGGSPDLFVVAFGRCVLSKCRNKDLRELTGVLTCLFQGGPQEFSSAILKLTRVIVAGSDPSSSAIQALAPVLRSIARQPIWKPGSTGKDPIVELMSHIKLDDRCPMPEIAIALSTRDDESSLEENAVSALAGVIFGLKKDLMKQKLAEDDDSAQEPKQQVAVANHAARCAGSEDSAKDLSEATPAHPIQRLTSGAPGSRTAASGGPAARTGSAQISEAVTESGPKVVWRARTIGRTANGKRIWVSDSEAGDTSSDEDESAPGAETLRTFSTDSESDSENYSDSYSDSYSDTGSYTGSYTGGDSDSYSYSDSDGDPGSGER